MTDLSRRSLLAGVAALPAANAFAQPAPNPLLGRPRSVITEPPREWGPGAPLSVFPDPDIINLDPSFNALRQNHGAIRRVGTGFEWAEGPAWSGEGQYVVFSDVMGDVQYRYIWDANIVLPFRRPSFNSNGNSFDFQGRQISAQHFNRRVVRWEHDGSMTIIADKFNGQPLNSPNDPAPHPDGSIWFSDPTFGSQMSEGHVDIGDGPTNPGGRLNPALGNPGSGIISSQKQVLPRQIYRWDASGRVDMVATGGNPNGLAFSPDYKKLYFVWTGGISQADVVGGKLQNIRPFTDCMIDGVRCGPDGLRVDVAGNVWIGSAAPLGYGGVTVWNPDGKAIGRIRLPENCANLCFAGPKRDWLFMTASQSIYTLRVNIQGTAPS